MKDYGIRISYDGYDVKTCDDIDCVLTSKYPLLKGSLSGNGTITVSSGYTQVVSIPHNLGYIPMFRVLSDANLGIGSYVQVPYLDSTAFTTNFITARADSTNCYIEFYWEEWGGSSATYAYSYFIFVDKGNLN